MAGAFCLDFLYSVPLRGLWFLTTGLENFSKSVKVSVPLRGLWFLTKNYVEIIICVVSWFPSPYGAYGF